MNKLHFTNDCDTDMIICELQHWLDKADELLKYAKDPEHNPAWLSKKVQKEWIK